jgi:hypothetical protein
MSLMMMSENLPQKRYSVFVLAILLLLFACVAFILESSSFGIRSLGLAAILVSVWLVRVSNIHRRSNRVSGGAANVKTGKNIGTIWWIAGVGCLLAAGAAYFYLYSDALNGYHQVLPVYVFAGVGLACAVVWGYIAVKLLQ